MAWQKYFYNSSINSWSNSGSSTETTDTVKNGDTVFFLRSSRGDGVITLSGGVDLINASIQYTLTKSKFHFVTYPWPVDFPIANILSCIDTPYGRTAMNAFADQVHVWTGMAWDKYYYNTTAGGFVKSDDSSKVTTDVISAGSGVFFLRSSRGDGTLTFAKPTGL